MLNPTLLIAATVNPDGCIELPAAGGALAPAALALFWPGEDGRILQRVVPAREAARAPRHEGSPLSMTFFARCLSAKLGALTPDLFAVAGEEGPHRRLAYLEAAADRAREAAIRDAFSVHLLAFEERLI